ncbi:IS200/IS605 family transposase [Chlorogloeopsis fritschii PCC 9212]|uniref:Transposase n=1 Tax=Chlorogloeopsis fritschii PCC 6912 TaxID=211165 RepID=A0A433MXX0_CHLFR|nr:IS200/IS605 family transposase [Chlorogloeopsis fritschii]RUR73087.1 transposase [Chlorogloeopsis fritschii PCC 6912]
MALWRVYYHLVWATKERLPLIKLELEDSLYHYIIGKADSNSSIVHAIGGMEDHVHLVVSIPPRISIAGFVKNIKGSSSHYINHTLFPNYHKFAWQEGYGVFSLGSKQLDQAIAYVHNQKTHHLQQTAIPSLEIVKHQDDAPSVYQK